MKLANKQVLVFGSGISGIGASRLLEHNQADVILYDGNTSLDAEEIRKKIGTESKTSVLLGELKDEEIGRAHV